MKIEIPFLSTTVEIYLDGRPKPLSFNAKGETYNYASLDDLAQYLSAIINIPVADIKKEVFKKTGEHFYRLEQGAPDKYAGMVSLLSGKPFYRTQEMRNYPARYYFYESGSEANIKAPMAEQIGSFNKKGKKSAHRSIREFMGHKALYITPEFVFMDGTLVRGMDPYVYVFKIRENGKGTNIFKDTFNWYIIDQVLPAKDQKEDILLTHINIKADCFANIAPKRGDFDLVYDKWSNIKSSEDLAYRLAAAYFSPRLDYVDNFNLSDAEKKRLFRALCLEEVTHSYLFYHEAFHATNPYGKDEFANEFMAYLSQLYNTPLHIILFYLVRLAGNDILPVERDVARQILRAFAAHNTVEINELSKLTPEQIKNTANVIYVQAHQKPSIIENLKTPTNYLVFE